MNLWIKVIIALVVLCLIFFLLCFLGTGSDEKNIKSFSSYPDEVQILLKNNPKVSHLIKQSPYYITFLSNIVTFTIVLFIFTLFIRQNNYWMNFLIVSILGQGLNLFDFLVIDICWWRHSQRVRFSFLSEDDQIYLPIKKHFHAFLRGIVAFLVVGFMVSGIITAF